MCPVEQLNKCFCFKDLLHGDTARLLQMYQVIWSKGTYILSTDSNPKPKNKIKQEDERV